MRKYLVRGLIGLFFLLVLALLSLWLVAQFKTLRYPRLTFDPAPLAERYQQGDFEIEAEGAYLKDAEAHRFRAYTPHVALNLRNMGGRSISVVMENIHPDARLEWRSPVASYSHQITEVIEGLTRTVHVKAGSSRAGLRWVFPRQSSYTFLVMGDTGGDRELDWGLKRATQLGVDFVLNLGDLYYTPTEVGQVHTRFNHSTVPVFAALGNHDFRGPEGNAYDIFIRNIGPLNYRFRLLDNCFVNLDTGAAMFPAQAGERGRFLSALLAGTLASEPAGQPDVEQDGAKHCEHIVFTHKPFTDGLAPGSIPAQGHSIDGYQAKWLRARFAELADASGRITVLAGHIHDDFEFELPGIKTYVTGSGLAVEDLQKGGFHAKYLIGTITAGQPARYRWVLGEMPDEYHCSKKVWGGLSREGRSDVLSRLRARCP